MKNCLSECVTVAKRELDVYLDITGDPQLVGRAWFSQRRGGPITTVFAYAPTFIAQPEVLSIDPNLSLVTGNQYIEGLPGAFQDCAPDRWGRNLISKRHRLTADTENVEKPASLTDVDFLLGVSDSTRQGALRFANPTTGEFEHPRNEIPKLVELPRLLSASEDLVDNSNEFAAVKALLDAGSGSLGGARPKASVMGADGELFVAKFPHRSDEWNVMAWECTALDLAEIAGITVPERELVSVSDNQQVLLLRRFDRASAGSRLPYLSAMSMLRASDGEWHDYIEIADAITDFGSRTTSDLTELFRRAAFSVAIHNTDDHLRNHGFLAAAGGWTLSPVFDINPNPDTTASRVTGIAGATSRPEETDGLAQLVDACRLKADDAATIQSDIHQAVAQWRAVATTRGISGSELERFAPVLDAPPTK